MPPIPVGAWARDALVLVTFLSLGILVSGWFRGRLGSLSRASLVLPLGSGLLTWVLFLASWAGMRFEPLRVSVVAVACLLVAGLGWLLARRRAGAAPQPGSPGMATASRAWLIAGLVGIGLVGLLASTLSLARSYSAWDDMAIWSLKGYGIALDGTIFGAAKWGAHGLDYPFNIPLQIALFRVAGGDTLPESKILFPLTYVSLLLGCLGFWLEQGTRDRQAVVGVVLLATVPAIFLQATIGYANLHLTTYLVLGTLLAISGISRGDGGQQAVAGLLLGLAGWSRPEGVLLAGAVIATLLVIHWLAHKGRVRYVSLLLPFALILIPWQVFSRIYDPNSEGSQTLAVAIRSILAGHPALSAIPLIVRWNLRLAITPGVWGLLIPVSGLLVLIGGIRLRKQWPITGIQALAVAVVLAAAELFYWYITWFHGDIESWKDFDFARHFTPPAILLAIAGILVGAKARAGSASEPQTLSGDAAPARPSQTP